MDNVTTDALSAAASELSARVNLLDFGPPVSCVYNPLQYARAGYEQYLQVAGAATRRIIFLGMNPGPWGMAQTGVPFGEIAAVRDWLGIDVPIGRPDPEHPKRLIQGLACTRSEVSGRRLWGLFAARFGQPQRFFARHFVANYCPLVFMEDGGRNRTPDKLPTSQRQALFQACDLHLQAICRALEADVVVGVGRFAADRARAALAEWDTQVAQILHPSPASPLANRGWGEHASRQLVELGLW